MLGLIGLMFLSVDPQVQYTVDEVMEAPEEFATDDVNVRGIVKNQSIDNSSCLLYTSPSPRDLG